MKARRPRKGRLLAARRLAVLPHLIVALAAGLAPNEAGAASRPPDAPARVDQGARPPAVRAPDLRDGSRDFDFEFGVWKAHIARRLRPLTGSTAWVHYQGSSVVHPLWGGRANIGELKVEGPAGRIEGMSLRLYDPAARQWKIRWANARDADLGQPMVGGFFGTRGEFYNQEALDGRSILVRFIFSDLTPTSFRIEQAFSPDGGKSWEVNWIADFTR